MNDSKTLLALARETVRKGLDLLATLDSGVRIESERPTDLPRELKTNIDVALDRFLLEKLASTGLPTLAEESGETSGITDSPYYWVVDPLDGTANFARKIGQCAIAVALMENGVPVFGVIGTYPDHAIAWGGRKFGAFQDEQPLKVSKTESADAAIFCTGFPARFDFGNQGKKSALFDLYGSFMKIRMLGSAAVSLLHVARGSADIYMEKSIMLWDVAAGLAIVEGAGGSYAMNSASDAVIDSYCLDISASNGILRIP